ncbi:efflux RND transporter periplasmic adaptor subunit [Rhodoplanes azumiensis]|uniref:Efflux RND transporter periplasmic adaptor subunit n=1 Tax=Rhodoplanes azumiensis TaxID=1897628 RepID=A0ABW5ADD9_9BRAD
MPSPSPASRNERLAGTGAGALARAVAVTVLATAVPIAAGPAGAAEIVADCVVDPSETVKVGSPVAGILAEVLVKRGDVVARGEEIARLESSVEAMSVRLARAKAESTARIDAQRQRLTLAKARQERAAELLSRKIVAQDKFEELSADAAIAAQELVREEQEQGMARLELERAEVALRQRSITSPIAGVVTEKKLSGGEYIHQEGSIVTIARLDPLFVEAFLPVATYGAVTVGATATVTLDRPTGGAYAATVSVVDRVFDPSSGTYGVRMTLPNPGNHLPAGQRCRVAFTPDGAETAAAGAK